LLVLRMASCPAIDEGGLSGHRSEPQAPRRSRHTIVPNAVAEPPKRAERVRRARPVH